MKLGKLARTLDRGMRYGCDNTILILPVTVVIAVLTEPSSFITSRWALDGLLQECQGRKDARGRRRVVEDGSIPVLIEYGDLQA